MAGTARSGKKPQVKGFRGKVRAAVQSSERWRLFLATIDKAIEAGDYMAYVRLIEIGYGRPPQAMDITHVTPERLQLVFNSSVPVLPAIPVESEVVNPSPHETVPDRTSDDSEVIPLSDPDPSLDGADPEGPYLLPKPVPVPEPDEPEKCQM
jgi:hypothetical protein